MIKDAMRSLKDDKARAVFFALTFYLTSTLMFLFFNMAESASGGKAEIYETNGMANLMLLLEQGNIGNLMMVFIVIMCAIDIVFTNDFYVKNKAKELGVRMISGATYTQLAGFLLIQTSVMLAIAVPLGILSALALIPVFNSILVHSGSAFTIAVQSYALMEYFAVIIMIILWTVMLNMSFAFRSPANVLLSADRRQVSKKQGFAGSFRSTLGLLVHIFFIGLYLVPIYNFFQGSSGFAVNAILGCAGMNHIIAELLPKWISHYNKKKRMNDPERAMANGFLRQDLVMTRMTIFLYVGDLAVLLSMMFGRHNNEVENMLVLISYIFIAVLQAMAMMFRLDTELSMRSKQFTILSQTGFSKEQRSGIMKREILGYYGAVLLIVGIYLAAIMISLLTKGQISPVRSLVLTAISIVPLGVSCFLSLRYYHTVVTE